MQNNLNKRSHYIKLGFILILSAILLATLDYWSTKKINAWDTFNAKIFFSENKEEKNKKVEKVPTEVVEQTEETSKEKTTEPVSIDYYVGMLEIPKINLKQGFAAFGSPYNNISKNVTILPTSVYPDVDLGNFILAAHSGTGSIAFFKNLYKLTNGDIAIVYYNGYKYTYQIVDIYNQPKTGTISIYRDYSKNTLTLITCTYNSKGEQTVYIANLISKDAY